MDKNFMDMTPQEKVDSLVEQWNSLEFNIADVMTASSMKELLKTLGEILIMHPELQTSIPPMKRYDFGPEPIPIYPNRLDFLKEEVKFPPIEERATPTVMTDLEVAMKQMSGNPYFNKAEITIEMRFPHSPYPEKKVRATILSEMMSDLERIGVDPFRTTHQRLLEISAMEMYNEEFGGIFPDRIYEVVDLTDEDQRYTRLRNGEKVLVKYINYEEKKARGITYDFEGITPEMGFHLPLKNLKQWEKEK